MASPEQIGTHLDQLTTQFIDPDRMKGYSGRFTHKWPLVSYRSSVKQGKFAGQRPAFYHCNVANVPIVLVVQLDSP